MVNHGNLRVATIEKAMGSDYMSSRLLSRPQAYSNVQNKGTTNYDDSGQVFTETTCPAGPMTADWVWKTKGSSRQAGRRRSVGPGCSSLVNMAIRSALHNSFNITAESLGELPWEVASLLWHSIIAAWASRNLDRTIGKQPR